MKKIIAGIIKINIINIKLIASLLIFTLLLNGFMPKINISKSSKEMLSQIIDNNIEIINICTAAAPVKEKEKKEETEKPTNYTTININKKTNKKSEISKDKNKLAKAEIIGAERSYTEELELINKAGETKIVKAGIRKIYYFLFARSSLGSLVPEGIIRNTIIKNTYKKPGLKINFNPGFFINVLPSQGTSMLVHRVLTLVLMSSRQNVLF